MSADSKKRYCHVTKTANEQFEFNLKQSEAGIGQLITSVTAGGPADRAGLQEGDRIITLNGVNVEDKTHSDLVNLIRECIEKNEIKFEVLEKENASNSPSDSQTSHEEDTNTGTSLSTDDLRPRICKVVKIGETIGFEYETRKGSDGKPIHFIKDVTQEGPGAQSGLRMGDRIIAVGSTNIEKMSQAKVASLMKKKAKKVTLLVVDETTYKHFKAKKMKIKAKLAYNGNKVVSSSKRSTQKPSTSSSSQDVSTKPSENITFRLVHVMRKPSVGYGFSLQVKQGEKGEFIGQLVTDKPGARCGLMNEDLVVAVNGNLIFGKSHDDVTGLIKSNPNHVVLLVAGPAAIEHAKSDGILAALSGVTKQLWEKPKSIKLQKEANGYGFSLESDLESPKIIITDVENESPANKQGLNNGDVLACVNEHNVMHMDHDECVQKIKESGDAVGLIVGTAETMDIFYDLKIDILPEMLQEWPEEEIFTLPNVTEEHHHFLTNLTAHSVKTEIKKEVKEKVEAKPRLCKLKMTSAGFGFFLQEKECHALVNIAKGGPADLAGIQENDRIIEINGVNVEKMDHGKVVKLIKKSGKKVTLLVCEQNDVPLQKTEATTIAADDNSSNKMGNFPRPRFCELEKENNTFGFFLIEGNDESPGQYVRDVVEGGAGAKAGLLNGDRVIEVNGENVKNKTHDDVVALIKANGEKVNFLVVDTECDLFYKEKNIEITKALITAETVDDLALDENKPAAVKTESEDHKPENEIEEVSELFNAISESHEQEAQEETGERLKGDTMEDAVSEITNALETSETDIAEEASEILIEAIKEDVSDAGVEEVKDAIVDEITQDVTDEIKRAAVEQAKEEVVEDLLKEEILDEVKESIHDKVKEEVVSETKEEAEERIRQEMKEQIEREMRQKMEEEIKKKIEEEMKKKMEETMKPNIIEASSIPEPPKFVGSVPIANVIQKQKVSRVSVKKSADAISASSPGPVKQENLFNAISSLKKVQRSDAAASSRVNVTNQEPEEIKEAVVKPSYMSARAMFENGSKSQKAYQRPNWQRNQGASVKKFSTSYGRS